ncbi:hypothetical protein BOTBODRAFT_92294, partial [Botryobasidium botryosum FD-172 SS1]
VRESLRQVTRRVTSMDPREGQLDVGEAMYLDRNVVLLAGTGWGKTLAFIMACFLDPTIVIIIISPLNALEDDQARRFREWGLRAVSVNGTT